MGLIKTYSEEARIIENPAPAVIDYEALRGLQLKAVGGGVVPHQPYTVEQIANNQVPAEYLRVGQNSFNYTRDFAMARNDGTFYVMPTDDEERRNAFFAVIDDERLKNLPNNLLSPSVMSSILVAYAQGKGEEVTQNYLETFNSRHCIRNGTAGGEPTYMMWLPAGIYTGDDGKLHDSFDYLDPPAANIPTSSIKNYILTNFVSNTTERMEIAQRLEKNPGLLDNRQAAENIYLAMQYSRETIYLKQYLDTYEQTGGTFQVPEGSAISRDGQIIDVSGLQGAEREAALRVDRFVQSFYGTSYDHAMAAAVDAQNLADQQAATLRQQEYASPANGVVFMQSLAQQAASNSASVNAVVTQREHANVDRQALAALRVYDHNRPDIGADGRMTATMYKQIPFQDFASMAIARQETSTTAGSYLSHFEVTDEAFKSVVNNEWVNSLGWDQLSQIKIPILMAYARGNGDEVLSNFRALSESIPRGDTLGWKQDSANHGYIISDQGKIVRDMNTLPAIPPGVTTAQLKEFIQTSMAATPAAFNSLPANFLNTRYVAENVALAYSVGRGPEVLNNFVAMYNATGGTFRIPSTLSVARDGTYHFRNTRDGVEYNPNGGARLSVAPTTVNIDAIAAALNEGRALDAKHDRITVQWDNALAQTRADIREANRTNDEMAALQTVDDAIRTEQELAAIDQVDLTLAQTDTISMTDSWSSRDNGSFASTLGGDLFGGTGLGLDTNIGFTLSDSFSFAAEGLTIGTPNDMGGISFNFEETVASVQENTHDHGTGGFAMHMR